MRLFMLSHLLTCKSATLISCSAPLMRVESSLLLNIRSQSSPITSLTPALKMRVPVMKGNVGR